MPSVPMHPRIASDHSGRGGDCGNYRHDGLDIGLSSRWLSPLGTPALDSLPDGGRPELDAE